MFSRLIKSQFIKLIFIIAFVFIFFEGDAQASWEQYGQNRVQYRTFDWKYYDSTHFRIFYYDKGMTHAIYSLQIAEEELSHIVYLMGGRLSKKLNIVIYNSYDDFKQTNIGRKNDEFNIANGGKIDVVGDNIPVYFNGDHLNLKKQIVRGITSVIKDNMLFGDNLKDVFKNAVKMNLPEWYTSGYVSYISDEWTPEQAAELKSIFISTKSKSILNIENYKSILLGHSFWNFLSLQYGENSISNMLYLTRYRKSVNSAIEIVFKKPYKELYNEWENFYHLHDSTLDIQNNKLEGTQILASIKTRNDANYSQFSISSDGRNIAYVEKANGSFKVFVYDMKFNKQHELLDGGIHANVEIADPNYPLIAWSPNGKRMAILYQAKNKLTLKLFTVDVNKTKTKIISSNKIERVTGMCFMDDENRLAISAIKKGKSDLYTLLIQNTRLEPVTNDLFDDKNPMFVQSGTNNGILFLSNRTTPFLNDNIDNGHFNSQFNVFLYDPRKGNNLLQLSNTQTPISHPIQWGLEQFSFLTQEKDHQVRKVVSTMGRENSLDTFQIKNFPPLKNTLVYQTYIQQTAMIVEIYKNGSEFIIQTTPFSEMEKEQNKYWEKLAQLPKESSDEGIDHNLENQISNYITPFDNDTNHVSYLDMIFLDKKESKHHYQVFNEVPNTIKPKLYLQTFHADFLQTSLDNTLLFTRYQPFDYYGGQYQNPPISGFVTASLTDIMEDYKIISGGRLGSNLTGIDYFLQYNNFRKRVDWGLLYFHHATTNLYDLRRNSYPYYSPYLTSGRVSMDYLQANVSYPLNLLTSIRMQLGIRYDKIKILAKDKYSVEMPNDNQVWAVSRAEIVYDNAYSPILNIWHGSKLKLFGEYQYKMNNTTKGFYAFGFDLRNYLPIYKKSILASRLASSFSGGNAKVLYLLGGVDNPLNAKRDENTSIDYTQNYAFQSLATNMRGYNQGFRNGNSYLILNEEIRIPIWSTFFKRQAKSPFLKNLQLVAFSDIGSAWKGIIPDEDNIKQNNVINTGNSPVTVYLDNSTYNFGWGYGLGLRAKLLGYFIRTDFAWNIEGIKKPLIHLSLATDF
ncbi:MAG TPA: hypothetical protein PKA54_08950 [Chitinophagaceae bacterium]|nr:MAG: WD40 domain-containing protein beta Propeller [Bacteroidetes bacterium OLB11]HMN33489.1 hypothetical protein [Chitinophagaceae bacterium]